MSLAFPYILIATLVSAIAAVTDWRSGRIPNWLTLGTACVALVLHVTRGALSMGAMGAGTGALTAIAGALLCCVVPLFLYQYAGMGGGDLKLLTAIGALCGPVMGLQAQFYAFIAVLVYAPGKLAFQGKLFQTLRSCCLLVANPFRRKDRRFSVPAELRMSIRFGPAVFAAVLVIAVARLTVQ